MVYDGKSPYDFETLINKEVIAINQDPLGAQGILVAQQARNGSLEYWAKPLQDGSYAIAFLNRQTETRTMSFTPSVSLKGCTWDKYTVRDLWKHNNTGTFHRNFSAELIPHEAKVFKISPA